MKKFLFGLCSVVLLLGTWSLSVAAEDDLLTMTQNAGYPATAEMLPKASIVIDADTGQLLWGQEIDLKWDPASTTKTMVVYLTMEAISQGKISMDTEVVATENDQAIASIYALSNNKIIAGKSYTVRELLTMTLVPSSNVTTLMLAHLIHEGSDASFLQLMNDTAKELGMSNTTFYNATGAVVAAFQGFYAPEGYDPNMTNEVTAKDMAILAYHLIKKHPDVLEFTNQPSVTVKAGTELEETFDAYNYSLPGAKYGFEGVDGLKTGSSPSAGFNSIVTAKRGDVRLISVVLGVGDWAIQDGEYYRHYFVNTLLENVFTNYKRQVVAPAGQQDINGQTVVTDKDLYALVKEGETPELVIENQLLKVAGSLDPMSGVSVKEADVTATASSDTTSNSQPAKQSATPLLTQIPKEVYLSIPVLIVIVGGAVLASRRGVKKTARKTADSQTYSRRKRGRKLF
ncbi:D-alanyl-D-alanine carboxypeptidase family protein [Streptococcus ovis]|uniref:D-alanyl-D-alanine carboxypeptidase family protein n=1 Tax=Streptococcus ovis TaxID=82806 RepID=UPI00035C15EC|nr:D-alanyl-D-alanine carboxypeptidase family protein [Streptococcus ovis]